MRKNLPVTNQEYRLPEGITLVSRTDSKGRITYTNDAFVEVSGFTREELVGQPHNLVRHPDVPPEVFRDMWSCLLAGRPWSGVIKNRRKDGDHYWVRANVNAIKNGGFHSVRFAASREEVAEAERLYETLRGDSGYGLESGRLVKKNRWWKLRRFLQHISLRQRFLAFIITFTALFAYILVYAWISVFTARDAMHSVYQQEFTTLGLIYEIAGLQTRTDREMLLAYQHAPDSATRGLHAHPVSLHLDRIETYLESMDSSWARLKSMGLDDEGRGLAESYHEKEKLWRQSVLSNLAAMRSGQFDRARLASYLSRGRQYSDEMTERADQLKMYEEALVQEQIDGADARYQALVVTFTVALLLLSVVVVVGFSAGRRSIRLSREAMYAARRIADGEIEKGISVQGYDEFAELMASLEVMRNNLMELLGELRIEMDQLRIQGFQEDTSRYDFHAMIAASTELRGSIRSLLHETQETVTRLRDEAKALDQSAENSLKRSVLQQESTTTMAASVEELLSSIEHVTGRANETKQTVQSSAERLGLGEKTIQSLLSDVRKISEAVTVSAGTIRALGDETVRIAEILSLVREITDRTNLLALNATIEAARAGDSGRGFAVVADEVTKLAARTSDATVQIHEMVGRIQSGAKNAADSMEETVALATNGSNLAFKANEELAHIREANAVIVEAVTGIEQVLQEQEVSAGNISGLVSAVAENSDRLIGDAEHTRQAAGAMGTMAASLQGLVSRFEIRDEVIQKSSET